MIKNVEFKTPNNEVLQETNLVSLYDIMSEKIVKESEDFGGKESGWILNEILRLEVRTNRYSPFRDEFTEKMRIVEKKKRDERRKRVDATIAYNGRLPYSSRLKDQTATHLLNKDRNDNILQKPLKVPKIQT
ncbi:hypothetical protein NPIL_301261 [Nephila pilipes]|uniref:Uncharacterized protein n=1 Tax=Nephila pilipes TaxID=299642 RepID=A0A8X6UF47_NEPPI|nr:hypothetical protein NPIL_301261 [Nephila pilipes]